MYFLILLCYLSLWQHYFVSSCMRTNTVQKYCPNLGISVAGLSTHLRRIYNVTLFYSDKDKRSSKSSKDSKSSHTQNRNLWITNISQNTRATELKQVFSAHGKVIGAKVVINAKYPGACCYGYVTMDTIEDAEKCIKNLNNTELKGQIIKIEKVRSPLVSCLLFYRM